MSGIFNSFPSTFSEYSLGVNSTHVSIWDSNKEFREHDSIFLIPGLSYSKEVFYKQFESDLPKSYRLIAIDLPGHGNSKVSENDSTIEKCALLFSEVIKTLKLTKVVVIGWSYIGGNIALSMMKNIKSLSGVMIIGTPPTQISREGIFQGYHRVIGLQGLSELGKEHEKIVNLTALALNEMSPSEDKRKLLELASENEKHAVIINKAKLTSILTLSAFDNSVRYKTGELDQQKIVEKESTPLCVVFGKDDNFVNIEYVKKLAFKNLFNHNIYLIDKAGHSPFLDNSFHFNVLLSIFLKHVFKNKI